MKTEVTLESVVRKVHRETLKKKHVGELLKFYRKQKGYTQKELAKKAGISSNSIIRYEGGKIMPNVQVLQQLANSLGVSVNKFLPNDQEVLSKNPIEYDFEDYLVETANDFVKYLLANNPDVIKSRPSSTQFMQYFAAFLEERDKSRQQINNELDNQKKQE